MELIKKLPTTLKGKAEVLKSGKSLRLFQKMSKTRFNEILDRFMETFVAPRMAAIEGGEVAEVCSIICTRQSLICTFETRSFPGGLPEGRNHEGGDARGPQHHQPTL